MDIIFIICIFFLGWFIGTRLLLHNLRTAVQKEAKILGIDLDGDETQDELPHLFTEKENNIILVFDKQTNFFVCQGNTLEDAASKYKIKKAKVEHEDKLVWFINGKVETVYNES